MSSQDQALASIAALVPQGSSVLDLGCGDGALLELLVKQRGCRGQGLEIDEASILACVSRGLNVFHSDLEQGLAGHPDRSIDVVILNQSVQQLREVDRVLRDALRVGKQVIVGFPNFGHWNVRWQVLMGRTPVTPGLPWQWYDTPNVHFFSLKDFEVWCRLRGVKVRERLYFDHGESVTIWPNLFATEGVYLIEA